MIGFLISKLQVIPPYTWLLCSDEKVSSLLDLYHIISYRIVSYHIIWYGWINGRVPLNILNIPWSVRVLEMCPLNQKWLNTLSVKCLMCMYSLGEAGALSPRYLISSYSSMSHMNYLQPLSSQNTKLYATY